MPMRVEKKVTQFVGDCKVHLWVVFARMWPSIVLGVEKQEETWTLVLKPPVKGVAEIASVSAEFASAPTV